MLIVGCTDHARPRQRHSTARRANSSTAYDAPWRIALMGCFATAHGRFLAR